MPKISLAEMEEIAHDLPWVDMLGMKIDEIGEGRARVRLPYKADFLRPGGTISGPAMMGLADYGMYVAVLSAIGRVELAVTTNLSINFLRKPGQADIIGDCRFIKVGRRLASGEVLLHSESEQSDEPVAQVTATYSIPPDRPA